ncbi:hypothetical protein CYMTET_20422 [Cymbomonas tetramitiformis]|uniref:Uncharacterized protein n=1 Tax=Cymbomonas tetramitiformis TaxID=36881 RepID=A0AAE0L410_9CHLO|nr:hypothetical protein CYMTET_20422 [Cymbomonas tetramitiformis]
MSASVVTSSGEEGYSMGIYFLDQLEHIRHSLGFPIDATSLGEAAPMRYHVASYVDTPTCWRASAQSEQYERRFCYWGAHWKGL